jgi:chemotaxis protein MotB
VADQPIQIKKVKKIIAGHHGGAWKVAYADFMAAMMAFFLAMWLLMVSQTPEKLKQISQYFKSTRLFDVEIFKPFVKVPPPDPTVNIKAVRELEKELNAVFGKKMGSLLNNIVITGTSHGLRVELVDVAGKPIFESGSAKLNATGVEIFRVLCEILGKIDNKLVIEGHTDAHNYPTDDYTNWELSVDRASFAKKQLENNDIDPRRIIMIAGYGDTQPLIGDDPEDPRNRRISVLILTSKSP